ncbi:MAG TPA: UDP-N-acetylmuramoyl-L-alanine--D-glutamate ligase [Chloroflexi bacterium]|nr:UDP-N-acetylmuramoyl-L-alanine--D-glutamate ligase [Chloroflexota bacterium]HHW86016.1 UDP-N-acetylmuramoyl-L-alanine--D-glutamate ligase [Chloroflexota bacterium]
MIDFRGRRVVILGLARQGSALARFFVATGADVTISDAAPAERLTADLDRLGALPVRLVLGGHPLELLDNCDLLCLSGGVPAQLPIVQAAIQRSIPLSNDSLLTFQLARERGLGPLVAITGSSGKTTTTTLVGKMLEASGQRVHVGGNIGAPLLDRLDGVAPGDCIVLELSSFQLELFDARWAWGEVAGIGPDVAAILNITPNHLDRHPGMAAYAAAKFNLLRCLPATATIVLNAEDAVTRRVASGEWRSNDPPLPTSWAMDALLEEVGVLVAGRHSPLALFHRYQPVANGAWGADGWLYVQGKAFCRRNELKLPGEHNVGNVLAAAAISFAAGATREGIASVARTFAGVPHRLEIVAAVGGVLWVNDSIATSPERAVAGLRSFDSPNQTLILLAGGKDKNLPWEEFADEVLARVDFLIGFGDAGGMIVRKVQERASFRQRPAPSTAVVHRLDEAVELAARAVEPGAVVLLSPGGTSYDAYRDFEARGEHFRRLVAQIMEATA